MDQIGTVQHLQEMSLVGLNQYREIEVQVWVRKTCSTRVRELSEIPQGRVSLVPFDRAFLAGLRAPPPYGQPGFDLTIMWYCADWWKTQWFWKKKKNLKEELTASVLKKSKTHKRLKEHFLNGWNRTKRAHFQGSPLFPATYNIKTNN